MRTDTNQALTDGQHHPLVVIQPSSSTCCASIPATTARDESPGSSTPPSRPLGVRRGALRQPRAGTAPLRQPGRIATTPSLFHRRWYPDGRHRLCPGPRTCSGSWLQPTSASRAKVADSRSGGHQAGHGAQPRPHPRPGRLHHRRCPAGPAGGERQHHPPGVDRASKQGPEQRRRDPAATPAGAESKAQPQDSFICAAPGGENRKRRNVAAWLATDMHRHLGTRPAIPASGMRPPKCHAMPVGA